MIARYSERSCALRLDAALSGLTQQRYRNRHRIHDLGFLIQFDRLAGVVLKHLAMNLWVDPLARRASTSSPY